MRKLLLGMFAMAALTTASMGASGSWEGWVSDDR